MPKDIDTSFVFTGDTPIGKDPDSHSPTLRRYHKLLWSKPLSNGQVLELSDKTPSVYLHHRSSLGEFFLASDSVIPSFTRDTKIQHIIQALPRQELDQFNATGYTIGAMMLWPAQRVDKKMTINGARGFHPRIKDRFDLTVECIKRFYEKQTSPLAETLIRYSDYFALFQDFPGFVDFFLLHDLIDPKAQTVKFFLEFDNFSRSPLPTSVDEYRLYKLKAMEFIARRNKRIEDYSKE